MIESDEVELLTDQERFWAGQFGEDYSNRNRGTQLIASNTALFAQILVHTPGVQTVLEVGANIGLNIRALQSLLPEASFTGIEINRGATAILAETGCTVVEGSILAVEPPGTFDLVLTKGVLIHLPPDRLRDVYAKLVAATEKYLVLVEYYSPKPVAVPYRGHRDRLFKRDFAGEILDQHSSLELVATGFAYHRGPFPQDDLTWFVLRRAEL